MPFEKGESGNPGGRPKEVAEVRGLAKQHGPAAIEKLVELMGSINERTAVAACEAILNRGYGRPTGSVSVSGEEGGPVEHKVTVSLVSKGDQLRIQESEQDAISG
jgi:hypothetical protein